MPAFPSKNQPIQYINKIAYTIQAIYPIEQVKNTALIKEWLGSTVAFQNKQQGVYLFGKEIEEPEYEEI